MARLAFTIGEKVGPYTLLGKLAKGGMGELYRAQDSRLGREVAIKFLTVGEGEQEILRFEQEARTVGSLAHPHVVTVFDVGRHGQHPYIVTELLQGQTLRELLFRGPLPQAQAVQLTLQLLGGLDAAHARGIVHRDLKPENLFISAGGALKILDFGIAKIVAGAGDGSAPLVRTRTGVVMGTIGYCAPEQLEARPADARTDLFSVGVVLHEMLLGEHPLAGKSQVEIAHAMLNSDLPLLPDGFPPALREVVRRCEERKRDRRFSSARELATALEAIATSLPTTVAAPVAGAAVLPAAPKAWESLETTSEGRARTGTGSGWTSIAVFALILLVPAGAAWLLARREGGSPVSASVEVARGAGAGLVQAEALLRQAQAALGRGPLDAALGPAQEALLLYKGARNPAGALAASQVLGTALRMAGDVPAALARAAECAPPAEQAGAELVRARCLREQVQALVLSCEPPKALAADAEWRRLSAASGLDGAEVVEQAGVLAQFTAGRLAEAEAQLAGAEGRAQGLADRAGLVRLLLGPGDAFAPEASARAAEGRVRRALALAESLQQEPLTAQARLALARVSLALGQPQARELAAAAATVFEKVGAPAWEAQARATLALALLAARAPEEASAEAARAGALADRTRWRGAQLAAAAAQVAVHAAAGKRFALVEDARKLERLRDDAERAGCPAERLAAEVAIARALRVAEPGKATAKVFAEARKLGWVDLAQEEKAQP